MNGNGDSADFQRAAVSSVGKDASWMTQIRSRSIFSSSFVKHSSASTLPLNHIFRNDSEVVFFFLINIVWLLHHNHNSSLKRPRKNNELHHSVGWIHSSVRHVGGPPPIYSLTSPFPSHYTPPLPTILQGWLWVGDLLLLPIATQQMTACLLLPSFIRKKNGGEQLAADRTSISAVIMHKASTCLRVAPRTVLRSWLCEWMELWSLLFKHHTNTSTLHDCPFLDETIKIVTLCMIYSTYIVWTARATMFQEVCHYDFCSTDTLMHFHKTYMKGFLFLVSSRNAIPACTNVWISLCFLSSLLEKQICFHEEMWEGNARKIPLFFAAFFYVSCTVCDRNLQEQF